MEDARADAGKTGRTSLGLLVKELLAEIDDDRRAQVQNALDVIADVFGATADARPEVFDAADCDLTATLREFIPGMSAHLHVDPPTFDDVVTKGATILLAEDGGEPQDIGEYGHGTQRSTQMALVHLLASRRHHASAVRPALLIDEPELYLHPQAVLRVRGALQRLAEDGYQTVFSTHTPEMVGRHGYPDAVVLVKDNGATKARPSLSQAVEVAVEAAARNETLFSFRNASEMLFSDRVVVVEGKDDKACVEELYEMDRQRPLGHRNVGVVAAGGSGVARQFIQVLGALGVPYLLVADLDVALYDGRVLLAEIPSAAQHETDVAACTAEFAAMNAEGAGITLDVEGRPTNGGAMTANEAFSRLADRPSVSTVLARMHDRMRDRGVWLWTCGALEQVLGDHGTKKRMRENALAAAHRDGPSVAIKRMDLVRSLFDAIEDESAFWNADAPVPPGAAPVVEASPAAR